MSDTMREAAKLEAAALYESEDTYNYPEEAMALAFERGAVWQAAQSQPAPMKLPKLPEPDTTHYAQWAGDRIKYHSVDQIIEFADARVTAALAAARKGKS